jgi:methylenetetrahydrofolate reductase (NADPH)
VGVAGYPEVHIESPDMTTDIANLKKKVYAGADFIITQLFFDNSAFYRFRDEVLKTGIAVPVIAGIFPLFNFKQIPKILSLSNTRIPSVLFDKLSKVSQKPEEVEKYSIEYAIRQGEDLISHEVAGLHFYSMNKSRHISCIIAELDFPGPNLKTT